MQTFDVLAPASHSASPLNGDPDFAPQTPPSGAEKFGDVMDRALSGPPTRDPNSNSDDSDVAVAPGHSGKHDIKTSGNASPSKHATKLKKLLQKDPSADTPAANAQQTEATASVPRATQAINTQIVPQDDGVSEEAPSTGTAKGKHGKTRASSTETAKPTASHLFTITRAPLGIPVAISTQTPCLTSAPKDSKGSEGASTPVPNIPAKGEAKTEVSGDAIASIKEKISETSDESGKSVPEKPDSKDLAINSSSEHPENTAPATPQAQQAPSADAPSGKAIPMDAFKTVAPEVSNAQIPNPKAPVNASAPPEADPGGISAAKQDTTMKKAEKTPKVAGQNEQDLPGNPTSGSEEPSSAQKLPAHAWTHASAKIESPAPLEMPASQRISSSPESTTPAVSAVAVPPASATDSRMQVLERTHDMVAMHAVRLAQTGSDSLHVVVKPGDGVQLSLELRQSEGMVQVHAALHKGDFEHMSQHWPELQQRLEARGIRVGTLTTSDNFSSTSQQNSQQNKQQSSQHDPLYAGAFAEFALAGSLSETPAVRAARPTVHRGWETWA